MAGTAVEMAVFEGSACHWKYSRKGIRKDFSGARSRGS